MMRPDPNDAAAAVARWLFIMIVGAAALASLAHAYAPELVQWWLK